MNVYILAPQNRLSGGAELAHQLCHAINTMTDINAFMVYVDVEAPFDRALGADVNAPKPYNIYETSHVTDIAATDQKDNVYVFPEGLTYSMPYVRNVRKILWWMSVDNYLLSTKEENLGYILDNVELHLFQSYYAEQYVKSKKSDVNGMYLEDYINDAHGKFIYPAEFRQNIALYNPAKGLSEIKPLIEKAGWIQWVPLKGLAVEKMVLIMQSSKIYVDFGEHPGKDRIPREAAANGCCVITNKKGAAANDIDVPIPAKYKFEDTVKSLNEIDRLLHEICDDFKNHQDEFESYRNMIREEKSVFEKGVVEFIDYLKQ